MREFVFVVPSEESLELYIPSYPGSPRSISIPILASDSEDESDSEDDKAMNKTVQFLHDDNELLLAAESGNDRLIKLIIRNGANVNVMDHLGRNALHLAVATDNDNAIITLLLAGVDASVKDHLGMTPLLLCLMRRPSIKIANLLFSHGARILPRVSPMDTGIFIQFVMMCTPTDEEEQILRLLVEKGALVNDPFAPGQRQALHFAAMINNTRLIRILIELGGNPYWINHRNETAREVALIFKSKEAASLLAEIEKETIYGCEGKM